MFCSNCGSELAAGARFCSVCGAKVEYTEVRPFDTQAYKETVGETDVKAGGSVSAEEAFKEKVSFDWSNVIDEPQKKEIPQDVKSPWAATTDGISERELYSEMTQTDDKNRTMDFIDILKREDRERAAVDKSIEYTEVLEIDPELTGSTKPPKLRYAPLYDDVDEPVKTPFDEVSVTADEADMTSTAAFEAAEADFAENKVAPETSEEVRKEASKFEIPDFLKRAVGFGAPKEEEPERIEKVVVEEPVFEAPAESVVEEPVIEEPAYEAPAEPEVGEPAYEAPVEPVVEEPVFEAPAEPVIEEPVAEVQPEQSFDDLLEKHASKHAEKETEDIYLEEDLYLDMGESSRTERMSRVDAHTLAGVYDETDLEEDIVEEIPLVQTEPEEQPVDEKELFTEMSETPAGHTGMTIAAPADEEEEIEALKRRLAELTGAVDMSTMAEANAEMPKEPVLEEAVEDEYLVAEEPVVETPVVEAPVAETPVVETPVVQAPVETAEVESPKFEDFKFEPEITAADDKLFANLTPAREAVAEAPAVEAPVLETPIVETPAVEAPVLETPIVEAPVVDIPVAETKPAEDFKLEDFVFEPEVTAADDKMFDDLSNAGKASTETQSFGLTAEDEPVVSAKAVETPQVEAMAFDAPAPTMPDSQKDAFDSLVFDFPQTEGSPADDSPIVGFAPAITEAAKVEEPVVKQPVVEEPAVAATEPIPVIKETPPTLGLEPKKTDAVSLEDLEQDLFGEIPNDAEPETTKKIDKFYTLYRKNEEFQRLLDEEYSRLKGEHIQIPEEEVVGAAASAAPAAMSLEDFAKDTVSEAKPEAPAITKEEIVPPVKTEAEATTAVLEELAPETRPVEDATIYRADMPEELVEAAKKAEENTGFSVGTPNGEGVKLGLDGTETAAAAAAVAATGTAVAAAAANDKEAKKAAKKAEREAKKAAKKAQKEAAASDPQVDYENVDGGSTILTILAVLVAILLVVLLVIILILHVAPDSGIAMKIDQIIENITSSFSAIQTMSGINRFL